MSLHICVLGIDGSGKSTISSSLPVALASKINIATAGVGETLRLVERQDSASTAKMLSQSFSIAARLASYFKKMAKKHVDNRKIYPLFKLLHMAFQDRVAQQIEKKFASDVIISDGNLLLCTLGRAANCLQPASDREKRVEEKRVQADDFGALLNFTIKNKSLPETTKRTFPYYKKAKWIRMISLITGTRKMLLPDMVFFLDVDSEIAMERIKNRGQKIDRHENINDLNQAREMYHKALAAFDQYRNNNAARIICTTNKTPDQVLSFVTEQVERELKSDKQPANSFNKKSRPHLFNKLSSEMFDLVIIGGGVTGASIFRDAAMRGLKVALVEAKDFSWGTSSRSSKLIHGGLRYLKHMQLRLAHEACQERNLHIRLNKRLVEPLPFLFPIYKKGGESKLLFRVGMILYEILSGFRNYKLHRFLSKQETLAMSPGIVTENLTGGCLYYDASVSDYRWTLEIIKDGVRFGGTAINYAPVKSVLKKDGRVTGVQVMDEITGTVHSINSRAVVNASGVWMDSVRKIDDESVIPLIRLSRGTHLVFDAADVPINVTTAFSSPIDKRPIYLIKQDGYVLFGTSDRWANKTPSDPAPTEEDVEYLLNSFNIFMPQAQITKENIRFMYSGFRPLIQDNKNNNNPSDTCREDLIEVSASGVIHIMGGKLTTARKMAERVVDLVVKQIGCKHKFKKCQTHKIPIGGSGDEFSDRLSFWNKLYPQFQEQISTLYKRYGQDASAICSRASVLLDKKMSHKLLLQAEIQYVCQNEMVCTVADLEHRMSCLSWSINERIEWLRMNAHAIQAEIGLNDSEFEFQVAEFRKYLAKYHSIPKGKTSTLINATQPQVARAA